MIGLIEEIQRDALNESVSVENILRKVKAAASKLKISKLEDWVSNELNGFSENVPEYRIRHGQPQALNPYNGWIPIAGDAELIDLIGKVEIRQSISSLTDLLRQEKDGGTFTIPLTPQMVEAINGITQFQSPRISIRIARGDVVSIVNRVRDLALDWALMMEENGIKGEEMAFNQEEKKIASTFKFVINNSGTIAGNFGAGNSSGYIKQRSEQKTDLFSELKQVTENSIKTKEKDEILKIINDLEGARDDKAQFATKYGEFIQSAANHMTVLGPFIPRLMEFLHIQT